MRIPLLKEKHSRILFTILAVFWSLVIVSMCFLPMNLYPSPKNVTTPGIFQIGRLYFLLTPMNSLVNAGQIDSLWDYFWILLQNLGNVFLLFPLIFSLIFLFEKWRSLANCLCYSFCISLFIECTQLCLDYFFDAGRVFELDDLWTNTLGGYLAYLLYTVIQKKDSEK